MDGDGDMGTRLTRFPSLPLLGWDAPLTARLPPALSLISERKKRIRGDGSICMQHRSHSRCHAIYTRHQPCNVRGTKILYRLVQQNQDRLEGLLPYWHYPVTFRLSVWILPCTWCCKSPQTLAFQVILHLELLHLDIVLTDPTYCNKLSFTGSHKTTVSRLCESQAKCSSPPRYILFVAIMVKRSAQLNHLTKVSCSDLLPR